MFDYEILMLRRSAKSQFMPNAYVFPGGVSSTKDFDPKWLDLIKTNAGNNRTGEEVTVRSVGQLSSGQLRSQKM